MSTKIESEQNTENVELQLGDIIRISNPKNDRLNEQVFLIHYIDSSKMILMNPNTGESIKLKISDDGTIGDGSITQLTILSRSDTPSYARQNELLPDKWVNIFFGGDYPIILTGEITNLENDMIEVKTVDGDVLYINFDYKGIPEDLPIEYIEIREKPEPIKKPLTELDMDVREEEQIEPVEDMPELGFKEDKDSYIETNKLQIEAPTKNIKNQIREFILRADQVKFGDEEFDAVIQYEDVSAKAQRYSVETQVSDMLDEFLSTIPNSQRTQRVLNNIHTIIERFKQLREKFSTFDKYGTIDGFIVNEANYKPLIEYFDKFNRNLYWILPVVKNIKKVYDVTSSNASDQNMDIIDDLTLADVLHIEDIFNQYKANNMQDKYTQLNIDLAPYMTPFEDVNNETPNLLTQKEVQANINVLIDNLENMNSYIVKNQSVTSRRFVITKYNLGLTKLNTIEQKGSKMVTVRVKMTNPDVMALTSILTLPEPTIRFSKINLPGTSLMEKANLNMVFLNYWQLLRQKTKVSDIIIDNIQNEVGFNEDNFVNSIKNYVLNLSDEDKNGIPTEEIYANFIKTIVPKTKVLFNLIKKYITGKLSIVDVVSYLEPFLIYTDSLTFMQYREIIGFINEKISEYNKRFLERTKNLNELNRIKSEQINLSVSQLIIRLISKKDYLNEDVEESYGIDPTQKIWSNSEILRKIIVKDYSRLYTTAIAYQNIALMFPNELTHLFDMEKDALHKKSQLEEKNDTCKPMVIAKKYTSVEQLEQDNGKPIYFDKKYDTTNYGLLDNYEKEIVNLSSDNFMAFLIKDLANKNKLNDEDAEYLADTLINGHKKVMNNQYAILYKGYQQNVTNEYDYYLRKDNKWVLDTSMANNAGADEESLLCNLQEKCISVPSKTDDKCESIAVDELTLQNQLLKDVISEFDVKYKYSKEEFEKYIKGKYDYYFSIMGMLTKIETHNLLKYNNQKYKLGYNIENEQKIMDVSPYQKLLSLILSQQDFVKKQQDIVKFVNTYTRPPILEGFGPLNEQESEYWLYCIKTNTKILPIFKYDMAYKFLVDPAGYNDFVDRLIAKIGKESDDGDSWTAFGSGWVIKKADFDTEEGYEEGFKVSTRSTLEEDTGSKLFSATINKPIQYSTPQAKMISNVTNTLSIAMGINLESQKEFIVNSVLTCLRDTLESEEDYKLKIRQMAEKGKKIPSYRDFYNTAIIYYTFGMFIIAIQTSIPSVKTRKTHPGCIRSFAGYPFEGAGDLSSLNYLACVAYDIRESGEPWNVLQRKNVENIVNKIKSVIDEVILQLPDVKRKFQEKTDYLLLTPSEQIPEEHDIGNWRQFLPPLFSFKIKNLLNISNEFRKSLINELRVGSPKQREKLLVIDSKIIQFSLAIQECIQNVIKRKKTLLNNSNNEPYLENACCESNEGESTIQYFIKHDNNINAYNEIVNGLTNIMQDILSYSKSSILCSSINTKNKYPAISNQFDEKTVYMAFIYFCKFKSLMPIPEELLPLCTDKPIPDLINKNDTIDEIIRKLKDDGRNYNNETFLRLLQIVGRNNIINIDLDVKVHSSVSKLAGVLKSIEEYKDNIVENELQTLIANSLDTFDIGSTKISDEVRDLNNYLVSNIEDMKEAIVDFIEKNKDANITRNTVLKVRQTISNLSNWRIENSNRNENIKISSENTYNIINFYKSFVDNFAVLFPNIILNKVDYDNIFLPKYLKISESHESKIKKNIRDYYSLLKNLYGVNGLNSILQQIQKSCKNLIKMSHNTPCLSSIKYGNKEISPVLDERTSKLLHEYYLLKIMNTYIELSNKPDMIVKEVEKEMNVEDIFTLEYLDEVETRNDITITNKTVEQLTILSGNQRELKQFVAKLLIQFTRILEDYKDTIDVPYEDILDIIFKLKEREKNDFTDRLKNLTDEERNADTALKINKLGMYNKGSRIREYDADLYDEEREFRDRMEKTVRQIRKKNSAITEDEIENIDLMNDYLEEQRIGEEIENEVYDMEYMNEDYWDGNTDGVGAPEDNYDDYRDFD